MIGATAEQSKTLVRIFEQYVRDSEHGDFKNLGFSDWITDDVFPTKPNDALTAIVPYRNRDLMMFVIERDGAVISER